MHSKSKRHKSLNTFRFQTFSERIEKIDIDVVHRVKHPFEDDDVQMTYYSQCLTKWSHENFAPEFVELCKKLPKDIALPQLLALKQKILGSIIDHIRKCDTEALEPALELIVAITRDLRKEVYTFFNPFILRECIRLLDSRDPEQIEWVFTSLAHLFKYLWSPIVRNIHSVLPELLSLLSNSQANYINNFAAESFAFVARKVRNKSQFLNLCLQNIKNKPEELSGIARLFFEVIRSVGKHFHSGAEEFLCLILRELSNPKWSQVLFNVCDDLMSNIISFVCAKTDVKPLWRAFIAVNNEFYSSWKHESTECNAENLTALLYLMKRLITCREVILRDPLQLMNLMLPLAVDSQLQNFVNLQEATVNIITVLVVNLSFASKIVNYSDTITKVFNNIKNEDLLIRFTEKLVVVPKYELIVLNCVVFYITGHGLSDNLLEYLARIVWIKTKFEFDDQHNNALNTFNLCLQMVPESLVQSINARIRARVTFESSEMILQAIILACCIEKSRMSVIVEIDRILKQICGIISDCDRTEDIAKLLYILFVSFQCRLLHVPTPSDCELVTRVVMKFVDSSNYLCSLRILDSLSQCCGFQCLDNSDEKEKLINNLCSPFHKMRLFTLQVLKNMYIHPLFEQLYIIESIVPTVETYRDKLYRLQKLEYNDSFRGDVPEEWIRIAVFKFLIGNLYINFQLMWEPAQKVIHSHLINNTTCWSVFFSHLNEAVVNDNNSLKLMESLIVEFKSEFLQRNFYIVNGVDDRPDFYNFRCLLLGVLSAWENYNFEVISFISELFLKFYRFEYAVSAHHMKTFYNIKKADESMKIDGNELEEDRDKSRNRNMNKLFIILLNFTNNSATHIPQKLTEDIFNIQFELLSNGNSEIQQLAIEFICKVKKMNTYRDRLLSITKDNSFKSELLNMRLDISSDNIPEKDKDFLMKIVLKLIFGKVRKKNASSLRDSMFEFLADCNDSYIISFFDMFFKEFISVVDGPSTSYFHEEIDLEKTFCPSHLLNYISTVLDLLKRCGKLLKHLCLSYLLKVILKVASIMVVLIHAKSEIHVRYYGLLSKIRVTSFEAIIFFFDNFYYEWCTDEIDAVFQIFIEPWIHKISEECLQSPNPLMKLFIVFTKNSRYFPLLAHTSENLTPLDAIMKLLNSRKVHFNVKVSVLEIIERLLTLEEDNDISEDSDLMYLDDSTKQISSGNFQYGTLLLLSHVTTILQYLEKSLAKKYVKPNSLYMLILKRVSDFGLDEEDSVTLLTLLMPVLKFKATADEDIIVPLLDTIFNLFRTIRSPGIFEKYLLQLAYLFSIVTIVSVRKILCEMIKHISQKTGDTFISGSFIQGLNMFARRWLDQPDYAVRLETFKKINEAAEKGELNWYTAVYVIYNCFFMIRNEPDMALRDHSGLCLKRICPILARKYLKSKELDVMLNTVLLPLIKDGVQSKNENYQVESVALLGYMARTCGDSVHPIFNDLHVLTEASDAENDFFENIIHLQNFRKIRALKRFNEIMSSLTKPPQLYSLMFIFPLVSPFLLSEKTAGEHGLIGAAIETVKIICRLSPWHHYERIFKFFILELRKKPSLRKQGIRIVSAILDAFHFDLRNADQIQIPSEKSDGRMEIDIVENDPKVKRIEKREPVVKRVQVLCRSDAIRVFRSIKSFLVPSLDRVFTIYEESEQYHKLSKKSINSDKEEIAVLSIPIAYAAVKLLMKLPKSLLEEYISTIFLKLSTYLKSRLLSIRLVARETMQNILMEIGPSYFPKLLSEMMSILTKGFQIHVLVFTCHAILEKINFLFKEKQMDACIDPVLEICIADLFGKLAEEKEVIKISSKTPEAKGNKSYNMLSILAEHISEQRILDIVLPFKEILFSNMSSKIVAKVRRCLHYISLGLIKNQCLSAESLLVFSYGVSNDCIPHLVAERENYLVRIEPEIEKTDSYIIPAEPRHLNAGKRKICSRSNVHVIIEFGVELLESMVKRQSVKTSDYRSRLDPFVPVIKDSIHSPYTKLVILSMKCLVYLLKWNLPSLKENITDICDSVFMILGQNSSAGVSGENAELLMSASKVALVIVRDLKHEINNSQLRILLFVAEDLQKNISHYGTGFSLLKSIIRRQFNLPDVHEVMGKTAELSITSYNDTVRLMARKTYYQYLMTYPHCKKIQNHVMFYVSQLKYEGIPGRKSALEMLTVIANVFPLDTLQKMSSLLFVQVAFRLVQDENAECKKMASECISVIIKRFLETKQERELLEIPLIWTEERKILNRRLGIQLLGIFATVKKEKFESNLTEILPLIERQLHYDLVSGPGKYVKAPNLNRIAESNADNDELIFQVLQLYKTIIEACPNVLSNSIYTEKVQNMAVSCQSCLRHSHAWIRLSAVQILGLIFNTLNASEVAEALNMKKKYQKTGFLMGQQAKEQIKSLCLDLCDQLAPGYEVMEELLKHTMKNLLFLAEVLQHVQNLNRKELSLPWLVNRLIKQIYLETANDPQNYRTRTIVFNWMAALAVKLEESKLSPLLPMILMPILRELSTTDDQGISIRRMAKEVLKYYREKSTSDAYDQTVINVQRLLDIKRAKRKMKATRMTVVHPERAAKIKQKIQIKKKEQRKRRLEKLRKRAFKSGKRKLAIIKDI